MNRTAYSFVVAILCFGCASGPENLDREDVIRIAASRGHISVDDYDVIAEKDSKGWVVIFHGKSGVIGDEYAFFVDAKGNIRRVK